MHIRLTRHLAVLILSLPVAGVFAQTDADTNIVEERVTVEDGAVKVCGEGDGLDPCLDANGQTYAQEVKGPDLDDESESEMEAEAARVRAETPAQLDATIDDVEQGYNPDEHATMGLPD